MPAKPADVLIKWPPKDDAQAVNSLATRPTAWQPAIQIWYSKRTKRKGELGREKGVWG